MGYKHIILNLCALTIILSGCSGKNGIQPLHPTRMHAQSNMASEELHKPFQPQLPTDSDTQNNAKENMALERSASELRTYSIYEPNKPQHLITPNTSEIPKNLEWGN